MYPTCSGSAPTDDRALGRLHRPCQVLSPLDSVTSHTCLDPPLGSSYVPLLPVKDHFVPGRYVRSRRWTGVHTPSSGWGLREPVRPSPRTTCLSPRGHRPLPPQQTTPPPVCVSSLGEVPDPTPMSHGWPRPPVSGLEPPGLIPHSGSRPDGHTVSPSVVTTQPVRYWSLLRPVTGSPPGPASFRSLTDRSLRL